MQRQDIADLMRKEGFKCTGRSGGNHLVWSDGVVEVTTSATPSDNRALFKIRRDIRHKRRAQLPVDGNTQGDV